MKLSAYPTRAMRAALLCGVATVVFPIASAQAQTQTTDTVVTEQRQVAQATTQQAQQPTQQAQTPTPPAPPRIDEIVVTGSRIAQPNVLSSIPITSVSAEDLTLQGNVSLGDALNELPALRSTFSQANSTRFIGTAGLNTLDLRGQGTARTLVLVNGRRHVTAQPGQLTVDTNTIPADLLERVDVVTGGNSAIYGSDAVAGVVNFILKRDYEGVEARAQGGISSRGDRQSYFASVTAGQNFDNDRGNIAASFEYSKARVLFFTDRDGLTGAFSGRTQFNLAENTIGEPSTGNGRPDNLFFRGVRNNNISEGGLYTSFCPAAVPSTNPNFAAVEARRALNCTGQRSNTGAELGRTFVFDEAGNLIANPIVFDFRPFGSSNSIGGLGSTLRLTGMLQPGLDRKSANILGSYEFSEAFRPFFEAKFVRIEALQEGQPTFFNNTFSINNPFLSAANRDLLVRSLAPGATTFSAFRFNTDFGGRGEDHERETFRAVAGIEGTFNDDWRYEIALNYGRVDTYYETKGNVHVGRYNNSINAVRNAAGQIVCAINADASTANDDPACVPVNLFGLGAPSREALNYFVVTSSRDEEATQFVASGFVSGDLSQLFELPGGPVGFAVGGEFRRDTAESVYDEVSRSGVTFLNAFEPFQPPDSEVKEAFGELRVPLLADLTLVDELTLEAAGRWSDYGGSVGTVFAYNVGGVYAPVEDLRFRVGYAESVRAPTLINLFGAPTTTFLNGLIDPCSQQNINNNPNRRANCAAAGVPTTEIVNGVTVPWTNTPASGIQGVSAGNPNLTEEKGKSWTVGIVAQPDFIDGLTVSLDWYRIEITDAIFSLPAQTIIDQCYDAPGGISNQYCAAVFRRPDGTFAGQSNRLVGGTTISFPVIGPSFLQGPFNFARQETSGVDADIQYTTEVFDELGLDFRLILSYLVNRDEYRDINLPDFRTQTKGTLGDPIWAANFSTDLDYRGFTFSHSVRYIGKQSYFEWERQHSVQGRPPTNPDSIENKYYPIMWYHDFRLGYDFNDQLNLYVGVDNAFDRLPPLGDLGTEGESPFDNVGRYFYGGVRYTF